MRKQLGMVACSLLVLTVAAAAQAGMAKPEHRTVAQVLDGTVSNLEHEFVPAAEAMPEDGKFCTSRSSSARKFASSVACCGGVSSVDERDFPTGASPHRDLLRRPQELLLPADRGRRSSGLANWRASAAT